MITTGESDLPVVQHAGACYFQLVRRIQREVQAAAFLAAYGAVHYQRGGEGEVAFDVTFDGQTRKITFQMSDSGTPFDPLRKADPDTTLSAEEREIGGLGIFITKKTMDEISYAYDGGKNVLTMTKKI